jgi:hypothetical protein
VGCFSAISGSQKKGRRDMSKHIHLGLCGAAALLLLTRIAGATGITVTPDSTATDLVNTLLAADSGVTISGTPTYTGASIAGGQSGDAAGTFTGGSGILPFSTGIILSTGNVADAPGPHTEIASTNWGLPGDPNLAALSDKTETTYDASELTFSFIPKGNQVSFQYVFASEEYYQYINSFNDVFGFFLNGKNIALLPGTTTPVSIDTVNNGNPGGTITPSNPKYFTENYLDNPTQPIDLNYQGFVGLDSPYVLYATGAVTPNVVNTITLGIADGGDGNLDSVVFLAGGSFELGPPPVTTGVVPLPAAAWTGLATFGLILAVGTARKKLGWA